MHRHMAAGEGFVDRGRYENGHVLAFGEECSYL